MTNDTFGEKIPFGDPSWYQGHSSPYHGESHMMIRKVAREFIEKEIIPYTHEWDENMEIPRSVYKKMGSMGFNNLAVGEPYGHPYYPLPNYLRNVKLDIFHEILMGDELNRCGSGGVAWGLIGGLSIGLPPVMHHANEELKARVMKECLSGDKIICLAITEPTAGSDVAKIKCTATKSDCGKYYILNGEKKWITNGIWADYFTVAVRTGTPDSGMKGISLILVERGKGVTTTRMKCSGVWCSGTTFLSFRNVKVPVSNILGKENGGFKIIMRNFNHERISICIQTMRMARVCIEEAFKHAKRRKTFGKKLIENQVIRWKLAEMARHIEATQAWLYHVAYQVETMHKVEATLKLGGVTALLKVQCSKTFEYCARESAQVFGGLSYSRGGLGGKVERLCREVRAMAVPGGSEEIMLDLGVRQMEKMASMARDLVLAKTQKRKSKELAIAESQGVNIQIFGDAYPFGDPSWYQANNSPHYTESHVSLRNDLRETIRDRFMKNTMQWEERRSIPQDVLKELDRFTCILMKLANPSFESTLLPRYLDRVRIDAFHYLLVVDELATCGSLGLIISVCNIAPFLLLSVYTDTRSAFSLMNSLSPLSIPNTRNVVHVSTDGNGSSLILSENKEMGGYTLNGVLCAVPNCCTADCFLVSAELGTGTVLILINKQEPKKEVRRVNNCNSFDRHHMECSGAKSAGIGRLVFHDTFIHKNCVLPIKGEMCTEVLRTASNMQNWIYAIAAVRFARVCYEEALKFASSGEDDTEMGHKKTKLQSVKPVAQQIIRWKIAEMARQIESSYAWLESVTFQFVESDLRKGTSWLSGSISLLKVHACKCFEYCARESSQILGIQGYCKNPIGEQVERLNRDVLGISVIGKSEQNMLDFSITHMLQMADVMNGKITTPSKI